MVLLVLGAWPGLRAITPRLLLAGILVFSGSLYTLVLTDVGWFGAITPLGGLCLIAGWASLLWGPKPC